MLFISFGNVMGASSGNTSGDVIKENIKAQSGVTRMMVRPTDDTSLWRQFIDNAAANNGCATYCIHKIAPATTSGHYILESDAEELFAHAISKNVWIANYTEAALYYAEWASAKVDVAYEDGKVSVTLTDSADNIVYDEALTIKVLVPTTWSEASVDGEMLTVHEDINGTFFVYANIVHDGGTVEIIGA